MAIPLRPFLTRRLFTTASNSFPSFPSSSSSSFPSSANTLSRSALSCRAHTFSARRPNLLQPSPSPSNFAKTRFDYRRSYATTPGPGGPQSGSGSGSKSGSNSTLRVWPFVAILLAGTGTYIMMVQSRIPTETMPSLPAPKKDTPTFSPTNVTVIFVLGGPGAGKGTQCANLVRDFGFTHLSAGDLLRAEQDRPESEFGQMIKDYIKDGKIVPMEVTVQLLENAITEVVEKDKKDVSGSSKGKGKFLIDGFPRKMDQALKFEETVCEARFVLFFDVPEAEMEKRLLKRGETSGRTDDNKESIKKRFKVFEETSMPVVEYYEKEGRVVKVPAVKAPEEVYKEVKKKVVERLGERF